MCETMILTERHLITPKHKHFKEIIRTHGVKVFKSKFKFAWKNDDFGREIASLIRKYL